jgi:hypothetical protein
MPRVPPDSTVLSRCSNRPPIAHVASGDPPSGPRAVDGRWLRLHRRPGRRPGWRRRGHRVRQRGAQARADPGCDRHGPEGRRRTGARGRAGVRAADPGGRDRRAEVAVYADALSTLLPSVAPLQEALRQAGQSEPECARAWTRLVERRAANMLLFARELRGPGELRSDLDDPSSTPTGWGIFRTGAGIAADRTQFTRTIVDSATRCPVSGRERARTCSSASSASAT